MSIESELQNRKNAKINGVAGCEWAAAYVRIVELEGV
jgi:hypothetical protein